MKRLRSTSPKEGVVDWRICDYFFLSLSENLILKEAIEIPDNLTDK